MTLSIRAKLFLTLLFACALSVLAVQASMYWTFQQGLREMVAQRLQARIEEIGRRLIAQYRADGGWSRIASDRRLWRALIDLRTAPEHAFSQGRHRAPLARRLVLLDAQGQVITGSEIKANTSASHGRRDLARPLLRQPLRLDGVEIGELILRSGPPLHEVAELRFRQHQTAALPIIALATLSLSALLAWWLSRWLARPVLRFRHVTGRLASGDFAARAPVAGDDELAALGRDLNSLAATLEQNEQARRRWMADISHELRTPLGLLRAELEAVQDGVRPIDTDTIAHLHGDTMRLSHLIDDLYQLSLSDLGALNYRKTETDLARVLGAEIANFRTSFAAAGLLLEWDNRLRKPGLIQADPQRLSQLFANLLRNSLQYSERGGALLVRLSKTANDGLAIDFQDTAPGVTAADRTRLFERLYRVEPSRGRTAGGAGLGLAIAQNIVAAHQGSIEALAAPQGGLWIRILLPQR
ncbi:MAG: two-component sensor histidine kinase [Halochromatium sp.]|nr:two-component sensor histidine kinase [Halochromatium sp.]